MDAAGVGGGVKTADGEAAPHLKQPSDDGTEIVEEGKEELFAKWLHENGGSYPKIEWPSRSTMGSVRGAIATEDIESGEPMLFIPEHCLISPPVCRASPLIGHVFKENAAFFKRDDDSMLATFVMFEKARGTESFFHPYIAMLPWPGSVSDWSPEELAELQDKSLENDAVVRPLRIKDKYNTVMDLLCGKYPDLFSRELHTLRDWTFSWMSVQARAFGRRLPWTALVPFADCLNHNNVQTKYDFNVDGNGMFRLFPTGSNRYAQGGEVFNSYGRRNNRFLLMEYGFALPNNEWDKVEIRMALAPPDPEYDRKCALLDRFCMPKDRGFRLRCGRIDPDVLALCRLRCMNAAELDDPRNELRFWGEGVSMRNELASLDMYRDAVMSLLATFPTTLEEDAALLAQAEAGDLPPRTLMALRYRHRRKYILHNNLELLRCVRPLVAEVLLPHAESGREPNDVKGLSVRSLQAHLEVWSKMASRGKKDRAEGVEAAKRRANQRRREQEALEAAEEAKQIQDAPASETRDAPAPQAQDAPAPQAQEAPPAIPAQTTGDDQLRSATTDANLSQ